MDVSVAVPTTSPLDSPPKFKISCKVLSKVPAVYGLGRNAFTQSPVAGTLPGSILFISERDGNLEVYRWRAGAKPERLTDDLRSDFPVEQAPDGSGWTRVVSEEGPVPEAHVEQIVWMPREGAPVNVGPAGEESSNFQPKIDTNQAGASEGYGALESEVETITRDVIRRGTVQLNLRVDRRATVDDYRINTEVLENYRRQIEQYTGGHSDENSPAMLQLLLSLPGTVNEKSRGEHDPREDWPMIEPVMMMRPDPRGSIARAC